MEKVNITIEEAISAIEKNKPTSGYYILREALDLAVLALRYVDKNNPVLGVDNMTGNRYQELASRTMDFEHMDSSDQEYHALFGMASEIGELHGIYQKYYQGHEDSEEHKKKELGDLLWFIAEYCTAQGWMLEDIMEMNIEKLKARFPDGFEMERSLHRAEGDI